MNTSPATIDTADTQARVRDLLNDRDELLELAVAIEQGGELGAQQ